MFVGPVGFATHFPWPEFDHEVCSIAVMRPPFAPSRSCCRVAERFPAARFSSSRVRTQRTGLPRRIAKRDATIVYFPTPFFAPKPPPM